MPHSTFDNFGLPAKLAQALKRMQFTTPTPIQVQAIPPAMEGKDILGSAQTGTGKTGAFGIPLIAGLMANPEAGALIMTPTRELAAQVAAALEPMNPSPDIRIALLIGGESMPRQLNQLQRHPRLIVGTPGRINDHLERGSLKLGNVRYLVLDETDRMLDMGFGIQIERILKHVSADRQTLLFSATMPSNISKLSAKYMRDPVRIAVGSSNTPLEKIKQEMISTTDADKYKKLIEQIEARKGSIIVFAKTKWGTQKLSDRLSKDGYRSDAIHGDLQQRRRDRVIQNFRDNKYRILVATDVAARGLDIPHIAHVINYDVPMQPEDYIHRIGRTARAGAEGEAVSFVTAADGPKWRAIQRLIKGEVGGDAEPQRSGKSRRGFGSGGAGRKPFWKRDREEAHRDHTTAARPHTDKPRGEKTHESRPRAERPEGERTYQDRPRSDKPAGEKRYGDKPQGERSYSGKPRGEKTYGERTHSDRPRSDKPRSDRPYSDKPHSDKPRSDRPHSDKPRSDRPYGDRPRSDRPHSDKPRGDRPYSDKPRSDKPHSDRAGAERTYGDKPREKPYARAHGDAARSDKPFGSRTHSDRPHAAKTGKDKPLDKKSHPAARRTARP